MSKSVDKFLALMKKTDKISDDTWAVTTTKRTSVTPPKGFKLYDITLNQLFVGDGSTAGGVEVADTAGFNVSGDVTQTAAAIDWDLIDDNASALSFDSTGAAGILEIVTSNGLEAVKVNGRFRLNNDIDLTAADVDIDLKDNSANALSIDVLGKGGLIAIDTTDSAEKVTMSGGLNVAGIANADGGVDRSTAAALALGATTASAVDVSKAGAMTTVKGTLNVDQAVTLDTTLDVTGTTSVASITTDANVGAAATGTTAVEYGDGRHHITVLTVNTTLPAIAGGANLGVGKLLYTLPAGAEIVSNAYMNLAITQTEAHINADTPDGGLGTTIASGVVDVLSGTAAFENILTGQTFNDCNGTAEVIGAPIHLFVASGADHTVYFNVADGWAASGDAAALLTGTVVLDWTFLQ